MVVHRNFRTADPPMRMRVADANSGAAGEWPGAPLYVAAIPTAGGINPEEEFAADRRRVRLRGRDQQTGESFGAELWLPAGGKGYGSQPARIGDGFAAMQDPPTNTDCTRLVNLQRALNAHYGSR
jgi:hypothetical protein